MKKITLILITLFLSSCYSVPANFGKPPTTSNIGLMLLIDKTPTHAHVGTTSFQNSNNENTSKTDFHKKFDDEISNLLINSGHQVKNISPNEYLIKNRLSLFSYISGDIHFKDNTKSVLDDIATKNNLDFIILVYPINGPAWANSAAYIEGYGLYTRCIFGACKSYALDYISARIYDTKNRSSLKPMGTKYHDQQELSEGSVSQDPLNVTSSQVDGAADKALSKFMTLLKQMLTISEFT